MCHGVFVCFVVQELRAFSMAESSQLLKSMMREVDHLLHGRMTTVFTRLDMITGAGEAEMMLRYAYKFGTGYSKRPQISDSDW